MSRVALSVTKKSYPLTSLRFFAAALVLYHHSVRVFLPGFSAQQAHGISDNFVGIFSLSFSVSVSFFFLLSGYVLSFVYLHKGQAVDSARFFAARFARIYPLYFLVLVLDTPQLLLAEIQRHGMSVGIEKAAEIFAANLLLLQAWLPGRLNRINLPSWSLCGEVFFYLCFPLLGVLLWKLRGARLIMTAWITYLGGQVLFFVMRRHLQFGMALSWPPLHLSTFALGILLARWQSLQQSRKDKPDIPVWRVNTVLCGSLAALVLSILLLRVLHAPGLYNNGLLAPIFAGLIWSLSVALTTLSRWLCSKWLVALGNSSYALYLFHTPILALFRHFHWIGHPFYPVYVALCVGLSLVSFHYFETPVRLRLVDWVNKPSPRPVETISTAQEG